MATAMAFVSSFTNHLPRSDGSCFPRSEFSFLRSKCPSELRWRGTRRGGCCVVAKISETQPAIEQQETEARDDERTGVSGYKLKENEPAQPVRLEMEAVDDVVRPKRVAFNYGFQAKFLRTGPSVPGNVIKLAFENFGREWRVSLQL